jgi:NADH-quinone oxidoreductase subunit M
MANVLSWMTFFPAIGAALLLFVPAKAENLIKWIAVAATSVPLLLTVWLLQHFNAGTADLQFVEHFSWIPSFNIDYNMGVDGISILLVFLTGMLSFLCIFASWGIKKMVKQYFIMFLMLHVGMMGVFCAQDFFLFYMFWEIMLLPMYFLVGIWGGEKKEYAAIKFFLYTLFGSVLMLVAMLALYFYSKGPNGTSLPTFNFAKLGSMDWTQYKIQIFGWDLPFDKTIWFMLFIGFAIKVPVFPFHTWLPWAHVQAPTAVSIILAGVLLKMGTYGLLRVNYMILPQATKYFSYMLLVLGLINIIYGALCAMAQRDLKKLVAYSSVSHMGYCLIGMAVFTPAGMMGAVLQMFNHGISAAMMFMLVGVLYDRLHHRYIVTPDGKLGFGGIAQKAPWTTAIWTVAVFSSLGLPFLNGFISEALVFMGAFPVYKTETIIAGAGIVLTAAYLLWMVQRVFLGPFTTLHKDGAGALHGAHEIPEVTLRELVVLAPLGAWCVIIGVYPQPILDLIKVSVNKLLEVYSG